MQIQIQQITPTRAIIRPDGRMDVESAPAVKMALANAARDGLRAVVVDLSLVEFMDSSGLSALVSGMKALRKEGGALTICNANAQIRTALRLTMLDRVFPVYENLDKALQALNQE
jgi:anti-anti-sigma factor